MLGAIPPLLRTPLWRVQERLYFYLTQNYTFVGGRGEGKGAGQTRTGLAALGRI